MSQRFVKVNVTAGSPVVKIVGEDATSWIRTGVIFMKDGSFVPYTCTGTVTLNGEDTDVTLAGNYTAVTESGVDGVFTVDLTYPSGIPTLSRGDVGTAAVFTAAMLKIQDLLALTTNVNLAQIETFKDQAEVAANRSIAAADAVVDVSADRALAETAATTATSAKNAALTSQTAAAISASAATTSQNAAAAAAIAANVSQNNAGLSAQASASSAAASASSQTAAASSATSANSSAATATAKATAAASSQAAAAQSEANAGTMANAASQASVAAASSASNMAQVLQNAQDSAGAASNSANLAQAWANAPVNSVVANGQLSAFHWAQQAQNTVTGALVYRGAWNASSGVYPTSPAKGDFYKIAVAGTILGTSFLAGDSIIYNGASWDKLTSTDAVTSVAGRVGAITLTPSDIVGLSTLALQAANAVNITGGTAMLNWLNLNSGGFTEYTRPDGNAQFKLGYTLNDDRLRLNYNDGATTAMFYGFGGILHNGVVQGSEPSGWPTSSGDVAEMFYTSAAGAYFTATNRAQQQFRKASLVGSLVQIAIQSNTNLVPVPRVSVTDSGVFMSSAGNNGLTLIGNGSNDNIQLRFHGATAGADQWAVGNEAASNGVGRNFDIYDMVRQTGALRVSGATGNVLIGTLVDSNARLSVEGGNLEVRSGNSLMLRHGDNSWDMRLRSVQTHRLDVVSGGDLIYPMASFIDSGAGQIKRTLLNNAVDFGVALSVAGSQVIHNDIQPIIYTGKSDLAKYAYMGYNMALDIGMLGVDGNGPLTFRMTGVERMRIQNSGLIGIGTSAPASLLHLFGTQQSLTVESSVNSDAQYRSKTSIGSWLWGCGVGVAADAFTIYKEGNGVSGIGQKFAINATGNVLINTAIAADNQQDKLQVGGAFSAYARVKNGFATASDLQPGQWTVQYDQVNNLAQIIVNINGVLKNVVLN